MDSFKEKNEFKWYMYVEKNYKGYLPKIEARKY
jgi:hypothetical protein